MLRKVAPMTGLGKKVSIVILAGGSVKIPAFRPLIQTYFGHKPTVSSVNKAEEVMAYGAAC